MAIVDDIRTCAICDRFGCRQHRRVSADPNDPGWCPEAVFCEVWLDGAKVENCVSADMEAGMVEVHRRDADGWLVGNGDRSAVEVRRGRVEIRRRREA